MHKYFVFLLSVLLFAGCTSTQNAFPEATPQATMSGSPAATAERVASESGMGMSIGENSSILKDGDTFESRDGSFQMEYPEKWQIKDMTPPGGNGQYGNVLQAWVVTSYVMPQGGQGGLPDNSIKIDFDLQEAGKVTKLSDLAECEMKSITCKNVTIDTVVYRRSESVLNTGMIAVVYEAVHNGRYFKAQALINQGKSKEYVNRFDEMAKTFRFLK
jgi:hypothetical protein